MFFCTDFCTVWCDAKAFKELLWIVFNTTYWLYMNPLWLLNSCWHKNGEAPPLRHTRFKLLQLKKKESVESFWVSQSRKNIVTCIFISVQTAFNKLRRNSWKWHCILFNNFPQFLYGIDDFCYIYISFIFLRVAQVRIFGLSVIISSLAI